MNGPGERLVRAAHDGETITVCQACSPLIADAAVAADPSPEPGASSRIREDGARP